VKYRQFIVIMRVAVVIVLPCVLLTIGIIAYFSIDPPPVPLGLEVNGVPGPNSVPLTWNGVGSGVRYRVHWSTNPDSSRNRSRLIDGTSLVVTGLTSNTIYYFWVSSSRIGRGSDVSPYIRSRTAGSD